MSRATRFVALVPFAMLALQACATGYTSAAALQPATDDAYAAPRPHLRSSFDLITSAELARGGGGSAYDVVMRLRPQFFKARSIGFTTDEYGGRPVVYYNGMRLGGVEELRTLSLTMVGEVRFLSPIAGAEWFGRYHQGGVISITSPR